MRVQSAIAMFLILATGLMLLVAGCAKNASTPETRPQDSPAQQVSAVSEWVGAKACAECHKDEAKLHSNSRHATTLRLMLAENLGLATPPEGKIPDTNFALLKRDGRFFVYRQEDPRRIDSIDLAFGSGKNGVTYAAAMGRDMLAEVRMTYFPASHKWYITPGQEELRDQKLGKVHRGEFSRKCVLCHAVALPEESLKPDPKLLGVGCEACHGAGGDHIKAMRENPKGELRLTRMTQVGAAKINALCDRCHTAGENVSEERMLNTPGTTHRFPFFGLRQSRCYQKNPESLSCITCHSPHSNVSVDHRKYESQCLGCHQGAASKPAKAEFVVGKPCPVNAKSGCVGCHMPLGKILPDSKIPVQVRDHFIHIPRAKSAASPTPKNASG